MLKMRWINRSQWLQIETRKTESLSKLKIKYSKNSRLTAKKDGMDLKCTRKKLAKITTRSVAQIFEAQLLSMNYGFRMRLFNNWAPFWFKRMLISVVKDLKQRCLMNPGLSKLSPALEGNRVSNVHHDLGHFVLKVQVHRRRFFHQADDLSHYEEAIR